MELLIFVLEVCRQQPLYNEHDCQDQIIRCIRHNAPRDMDELDLAITCSNVYRKYGKIVLTPYRADLHD